MVPGCRDTIQQTRSIYCVAPAASCPECTERPVPGMSGFRIRVKERDSSRKRWGILMVNNVIHLARIKSP